MTHIVLSIHEQKSTQLLHRIVRPLVCPRWYQPCVTRERCWLASPRSRTGLLLLLLVKRKETTPSHLHDLETDTGDVTNSVATTPKTGDQHFVIFINEVKATVIGNKGSNLLAVLDELDPRTFPDGGVGLLRFNTDLLHDDTLCVRRAPKGVALVAGTNVRLLVVLVGPSLGASAVHQLAPRTDSTWFSHYWWVGANK